jgi:hypothetical protein
MDEEVAQQAVAAYLASGRDFQAFGYEQSRVRVTNARPVKPSLGGLTRDKRIGRKDET